MARDTVSNIKASSNHTGKDGTVLFHHNTANSSHTRKAVTLVLSHGGTPKLVLYDNLITVHKVTMDRLNPIRH